MDKTSFSIELQGLDLPPELKESLQAGLRSLVLSEIAKLDLGKEISVRPLADGTGRITSHINPILGFVVQKLSQLTQRRAPDTGPSLLFTPPASWAQAQALFGTTRATSLPFESAPLVDVVEALHLRPDIRTAIKSNTRAFAEVLSRDEQAIQIFGELLLSSSDQAGVERTGPIPLAIVLGGLAIGALIGWYAPRAQ